MTATAESEVIASCIPNAQLAKLAVIDEASHVLVVEKPQEVTQIIRKFLKINKGAGKGPGGNGNPQPNKSFEPAAQ